MMATFSPGCSPSATSPSEKSRTWSWYSRQVKDCQMPNSFSRSATLSGMVRALRTSSFGKVSSWPRRSSELTVVPSGSCEEVGGSPR